MPTKPQKPAQGPPQAVEDPLADLRVEDPADRYPHDPQDGEPETPGPLDTVLVTQEVWDAARAEVIAGWHADTVSLGFLHKGGNCGCRYLAGIALGAVMPVQTDVLEPQDT